MSLLRNLLGAFMPHMESRRASGVLAAANAELVLDLNGDQSATIFINGSSTFNATYNIQGSVDGTTFFDLLSYPYATASVGGTSPVSSQPLVSEAVNAATVQRALSVATGGLQKLRVRLTAYTSGTATVSINSDECSPLNPYVLDQKAATLVVTATGAASAAVTATLPAVAGLRHYVDLLAITRSATAVLTASATPLVVTTTNLPGSPAFTVGADAAAIGVDKTVVADFGAAGLAAIAIGTATTVVAPVATGSIWRLNVAYRLGL